MQSSYFDYYHLTAGKKRLWATQMGSAFWISSVVGGHHNLMLRRQQPGEHPIIDPAQESLLFRRIVAMGHFIHPVDMQQHKGAAFRRPQGCLCLGVQIRYPQQAQCAVQCFRWEAAAGIHIPHRTHGRQMAISLHLKVGIRHAVNHA